MAATTLTLHHRQECLLWCDQRPTHTHEGQGVIYSDDSRFRLQPQDSHISVCRRQRDESTLAACIRYRHTDPSPGEMICGVIVYTSWSPFVRIEGTLNSARYISGVLQPVTIPFIHILYPLFPYSPAKPYVSAV
ncbi:transposable element Tcb1 transposase [Trichonephila clavipes]|nr:transposable element Tcb1 transposase [Trichonephila clavipes]